MKMGSTVTVLKRVCLLLAVTGTMLFQTTSCTLGDTVDSYLSLYGLNQFLSLLLASGTGT
jgi:hypothetical protein